MTNYDINTDIDTLFEVIDKLKKISDIDKQYEESVNSIVNKRVKLFLEKFKPDNNTVFNEITKTAITDVIPTTLKKIHKENELISEEVLTFKEVYGVGMVYTCNCETVNIANNYKINHTVDGVKCTFKFNIGTLDKTNIKLKIYINNKIIVDIPNIPLLNNHFVNMVIRDVDKDFDKKLAAYVIQTYNDYMGVNTQQLLNAAPTVTTLGTVDNSKAVPDKTVTYKSVDNTSCVYNFVIGIAQPVTRAPYKQLMDGVNIIIKTNEVDMFSVELPNIRNINNEIISSLCKLLQLIVDKGDAIVYSVLFQDTLYDTMIFINNIKYGEEEVKYIGYQNSVHRIYVGDTPYNVLTLRKVDREIYTKDGLHIYTNAEYSVYDITTDNIQVSDKSIELSLTNLISNLIKVHNDVNNEVFKSVVHNTLKLLKPYTSK